MTQDHSSPNEPKRGSTSIDQLLDQTAAQPAAETVVDEPAQASTGKRKGRKAAAAATPMPPEKQLSGLRVFFAICFAFVLLGGVFVFDEVGPSVDRSARITERSVERKSKGGKDYIVEGVDDRGGEFEVDVSKSAHGRASVGDRVVVTRSLLTGRVVKIDGPGWSDGQTSWKLWVWGGFGVLGVVGVWWSWRMMRRTALPKVSPDTRRQHPLRLGGWMAAAVVGVTAWVLYERADANVEAGGAPATSVVATPEPGECEALTQQAERWMFTITADGVVDQVDIDHVAVIITGFDDDCTTAEVESAICDELEQLAATSVQPLALEPATLCVGR